MELKKGKYVILRGGMTRAIIIPEVTDRVIGWTDGRTRFLQKHGTTAKSFSVQDAIKMIVAAGWDELKGDSVSTQFLQVELPTWEFHEFMIRTKKCECGSEKTRTPGHSTWCPKYEP